MRAPSTAALFLVLALAGCLADDAPADELTAPGPDLEPFLAAADALPAIEWNATTAVDFWEGFVDGAKRDAFLPDSPLNRNSASREQLAAELEAAGFDVTVHRYSLGSDVADGAPAYHYAVEAVWPGATDARIGLIAHYDTQSGTIEGAYDNGSGTVAVVETCKALARSGALEHTLACLLFDAEEEGTHASGAYVADQVETGAVHYDLVLGFDMVGINWPGHDWKLYQWTGSEYGEALQPFVERVMREVVGAPEEGNEVFGFNDRNSDEASFAAAHVPTVRFAGGRKAGDYPEYHGLDDTPEYVYEYVGGRENYEAGFGAIVESAYAVALMFDQAGPELGA